MGSREWTKLVPRLAGASKARRVYVTHVNRLIDALSAIHEGTDSEIRAATQEALELVQSCRVRDRTELRAALHVVSDLAAQRWRLRIVRRRVEVAPPTPQADRHAARELVRQQELLKREEQLSKPSTQRFIRQMERQRITSAGFASIFSLMRDGRELAATLEQTRRLGGSERAAALASAVSPYLQFVTDDKAVCEFTGLRLMDIWRYFRHTWTNQYVSVPGRTMMFLVRDQAAPRHPVMGIGSLSSPIVQIRERDEWIGWHPRTFARQAIDEPSARIGEWMMSCLNTAIDEVFTDDFVEEQLLSPAALRDPSTELIHELSELSARERERHHRFARESDLKSSRTRGSWEARARSNLYRSKRAASLATLLRCRMVASKYLGPRPSGAQVKRMLEQSEGRRVLLKVARQAKADRVGVSLADISVCGAVPPYNPILGGKLVAMLAASPEVVEAYRERYRDAESEIASAKAGRAVVRPSDLVFLGTTSLYGVNSSQYNRVRVPAERLGGEPGAMIRYQELGRSAAYGSSHYSEQTVEALARVTEQTSGGRRVNSIFGEGVSPKLRKVRGGLDALGFPSGVLLQHFRQRIVYGVSLVRNLREYLLGMDTTPDYIFEMSGADATRAVAGWWIERWLCRRVESDDVLDKVASHSLVRPIRHGARVELPRAEAEELSLFDDVR